MSSGRFIFSLFYVVASPFTNLHVEPEYILILQTLVHIGQHSGAINVVRVFPAFKDELLYVSRAGSVTQPPDRYPLRVVTEDDNSLSMNPEMEDFSDTPEVDSQSSDTHSESDLRANSWTPKVTDQDVHQQSYFFVLPKGMLPNNEINLSEFKVKYFLLCKNRRNERDSSPHFAGVSGAVIKRPADFLERFSTMVLWGLRSLKNELQELSRRPDGHAEYARITSLLQSELDLPSYDQVQPLVYKMIAHLQGQGQQSQESMDWTPEGGDTVVPPRLSRHDVAVLPSYLDGSLSMQDHDVANLGLVRTCDLRGHEQWVCPSCYHLLNPSHRADYITEHIGDQGVYDIRKSSIEFRPQSTEDLQRLCLLDTTKVGRVADLTIDMNWDASPEDLQSIHALAKKLCFSNLTITSITTARSGHIATYTFLRLRNIERISRTLVRGMKNLNIIINEPSKASALFINLCYPPTIEDGLTVTIKEPSFVCTAEYYDGTVQLLELEANFFDAFKMLSKYPLNGNLQYITITNSFQALIEYTSFYPMLSFSSGIKQILRKNPDLPSFTLHWSAKDFHTAEVMIESIYDELSYGHEPYCQLSSYTLIDNTDDYLFATFNLPSNQDTKSIVANVTVRQHGRNLDSFLDRFGPFVRNLNANDKFGPDTISTLYGSIDRKGSAQLTNVTISLGTLDKQSAQRLQYMLTLSKTTLQQVVLVGSPPDSNVSEVVVDTLESLEVSQVVLLNDEWNMGAWITQVQESLPSSSTLTVLDQYEDLRRIVPGYDDTSLDWLKDRQAAHLSGANSQGSLKGAPATETPIQSELRSRPYAEAEYKAFRLLGNEHSTTKRVPIINNDLGQVVLEKDIAKRYGDFDHVESNGRLVPFLRDPLYPDQ